MATAGEGGVKIGHDFLMSVIQLLENPSQISVQSHTGQPMVTISGTQPVSMTTKAEKPKKQNLLIFTKIKSPVKKQNPIDKKPVIQKKPSSLIPHNRVRMIMKTAPNTTLLSQETIALASKAAVSKIKECSGVEIVSQLADILIYFHHSYPAPHIHCIQLSFN